MFQGWRSVRAEQASSPQRTHDLAKNLAAAGHTQSQTRAALFIWAIWVGRDLTGRRYDSELLVRSHWHACGLMPSRSATCHKSGWRVCQSVTCW